MLCNYFSFIALYKEITSAKELRKLDPEQEHWFVVKKRSWLPHSGWLTTVYRGKFKEFKRNKARFYIPGKGNTYKGFKGEPLKVAEGLPGIVSESLEQKEVRIFRWDPQYALQPEATKPIFNEKTLSLINKYLW